MEKRGLKFKLILGVLLIVLIPLGIVGYFSGDKAAGMIRQQSEVQSARTASSLADLIELVLAEQVRIVKGLAENFRSFGGMDIRFYGGSGIDELTSRRVNSKILNTLEELGENYESIYLLDTEGIAFAGGNEDGSTPFFSVDIGGDQFFSTMKETNDAVVSDVFVSELTQNPVVVFCTPILDQQDRFAGAIGLTFKLDMLMDLVSKTENGETGYSFMVNGDGDIIAHPVADHIFKLNIGREPGMGDISSAMLSGDTGIGEYEFRGVNKVAAYSPVGSTGWSVAVTQNADDFWTLARSIRRFNVFIAAGVVAVALLALLLLTRSLFKPIEAAVDQINSGTHQVAAAAQQVSSGAETVAGAASKQMLTLDETVKMLSEVLDTVNENTKKARQTETFVSKSKHLVKNATDAMNALTLSMEEIEASGQETANIVNDIDRVAFETNLLALNAAVEAARAGEAGQGFAVVAEHVRSLAKEAAQAAGNSADLIEETTQKVRGGTALTIRAREAFLNVTEQTARFAAFVEEISTASSNQAASIVEINSSVSELEKMSRYYAAFAEESATASQRMLYEVTKMSGTAEQLSTVIGTPVKLNAEEGGGNVSVDGGIQGAISTIPIEVYPPVSTARKGGKGHFAKEPNRSEPQLKMIKTGRNVDAA